MSNCQCPACRGRLTKWTTTPPGWTDSHAGNPKLPDLQAHPLVQQTQAQTGGSELNQQCKAESNLMADGVFVWTEASGAGHAFLSLHRQGKITLYTYGRYGAQKEGFPLVGEGILLRMADNEAAYRYMRTELYEWGARVFKLLDADLDVVDGYMAGVYVSSELYPQPETSKPDTVRFGRVIDVYDLTGNNCTTYTVRGIKSSGSRVLDSSTMGVGYSEDFTIPGSLQKHLVAASGDSNNMSVIEVTGQIQTWVSNVDGISQRSEEGTAQVERSSAESVGSAGSSSGYSGGTVGGVLGGSYE